MKRRNPKKPKHAHLEQQLREDQLLALVPGGPVNPHRSQRDEIGIEARGSTKKGTPVVTGQYVSTPVRKLLEAGHITLEEASSAWLYERDRDIAYASSTNILASLQVDGGNRGGGLADRRLHHSRRFKQANAYLGAWMTAIAQVGILQHRGSRINANFMAIGADVMPSASKSEQSIAGRALLIFVIQHLAVFYGKQNPRKPNIIFEEE